MPIEVLALAQYRRMTAWRLPGGIAVEKRHFHLEPRSAVNVEQRGQLPHDIIGTQTGAAPIFDKFCRGVGSGGFDAEDILCYALCDGARIVEVIGASAAFGEFEIYF